MTLSWNTPLANALNVNNTSAPVPIVKAITADLPGSAGCVASPSIKRRWKISYTQKGGFNPEEN